MRCRRLLEYPCDVVHILLEIAMIAMYIASYGSSYGHGDVWPIKAQRPYSVLTEITAIQLKNPEDRHSQIHIVVFERLPQFKNILAPSFHHSSNILICRIYIVDQSCSPKAYRQPSTGRLQSSLMIWYEIHEGTKTNYKTKHLLVVFPWFSSSSGRERCLSVTDKWFLEFAI